MSIANIIVITVGPVCMFNYVCISTQFTTSPGCSRINAYRVRVLVISTLLIVTHASSSYRAMSATLASRVILNLRGSVLRPGYNEEHMASELNALIFNSQPRDQTAVTTYSMQDIEVPGRTAGRRDR